MENKGSGLFEVLEQVGAGVANGVGYDSLTNLFLSVFGIKYWLVFLESVVFSVVFTIAFCSTAFVETYLYSPQFGLVMFNVLIAFETFTGTWAKIAVENQKFDLGKFLRGAAMKPVGQNLVLFTTFNMAKADEVYLWLPITIWTIFTGVNFMKWLRNLATLGILGKDLTETLLKQFSDKYQVKPTKTENENGEF
jgi:hypothetical protein